MDTSPERFDRVTAHPNYPATAQRRIQLPDDSALLLIGRGGLALVGIMFTLVWIVMILSAGDMVPLAIRIVFVLFGLAFGATWVGLSLGSARIALAYQRAPIVPLVAVIIRDRSEVTGGDEKTSASTTYYATLQQRDGIRAEYSVSRRLAGSLVVGEIGVAYLKAHALVDFVRFDV